MFIVYPDVRMPEHIHDDPWRDALNQEKGGTRMAQIMEPPLRQARTFKVVMEVAGNRRAFKGLATWRSENET